MWAMVFVLISTYEKLPPLTEWHMRVDWNGPALRIRERFKLTPIGYVATEKDTVIGIIRGFPGRLFNLFVDGKHHRRGIGWKLLSRFELHCQTLGQETIKANVSTQEASHLFNV